MAVVPYKNTMNRILKSSMQKTFSFLGITLIVTIIFLLGAIKPTLSTITSLRSEIKVSESIDNQLETKLANIQSLQNKYRTKKSELEVIDIYFPSNSDYGLILASFEKITARYGFVLHRMSISQATVGIADAQYSGMEPVIITLNISGHPEDIANLLKHFEGLPIVPTIETLSFTDQSAGDGEDGGAIGFSVFMRVYKTKSKQTNLSD